MPNFFLVQGSLGAGKTLLASILAQYWRLRSGENIQIFSNYDMINSTVFNQAEQWIDVAQAHGSVIVWDEAQTQFDRRNWQRNTFMTQIFNYSRKMRCIHIFVNPVGSNLDGRILDFIEVFLHVKKIPGRGIAIDVYEYQDKRFGEWGRKIKTLWIPWHRVQGVFKIEIYDTDSILYPFPVPKTERDQTNLLQQIVDVQTEVTQIEKKERRGVSGWINPKDHREQRENGDRENNDEWKPNGDRLFVPQSAPFGDFT